MGYTSRNIANITEPKNVTLAANPNFVVFSPKAATKVLLEFSLEVGLKQTQSEVSTISITDFEGGVHSFKGVTDLTKVSGNVYYISSKADETAENIKNAMLSDRWIASNFEIKIPFKFYQNQVINGTTLEIKSRGAGIPYNIILEVSEEVFTLKWINKVSKNNDSITGEEVSTEIELDVYDKTGISLGSEDRPLSPSMLGSPLASVQKTYQGLPVWFDLNALISKKTTYNKPVNAGWFDAGTAEDYRFIAKVKGKNSFPFYFSNALYVINGRGSALKPTDLEPYIFNNKGGVKLLTNRPKTRHIKGQKEFLNFIFSDESRGVDLNIAEYKIGVAYKLYTFGGDYLDTIYEHEVSRKTLGVVNTCVIDLSQTLERYPNTGRVELVLTRNRAEVSDYIELEIVPECLHKLNQFIFLNSLGGWDSFNVDTETKEESKQTTNTFNKTLTPSHDVGDSIETVYSVELGITHSLETDLLNLPTRQWLRELISSPVVFDGNGNYLIIEDSKLPISSEPEALTIKYRLTDG